MRDYWVVVYSSGVVKYQFFFNIKVFCKIDVFYFFFDIQICCFVFGFWIYMGFEVNFVNKSDIMDMFSFIENIEWEVVRVDVMNVVNYYGDQIYLIFECVLRLRRKFLFYVMNLLFFCFVVFFMVVLGFVFLLEVGEKVNLEIIILLFLVVFQLVIVNMILVFGEKVLLLGLLYFF